MKETNDVRLVQKNAKGHFEIKIENKIHDEIGEQVDSFLQEHKRIYLEANPSYGKTYHIAQIGKAIKEGKSPFKRLIFCTPRLIIQEQFKSDNNGVDFVIDGKSDMKKFKPEHQIITSTFNSLHRIPNGIKSTDLVVVDEAHIMLTNYNSYNKTSKSAYYDKLLQILYNNDNHLILMSGTPTFNFHKLLGLTHLKVKKENEDVTQVNIYHNHQQDIKELAYRYCKEFAVKHPDSLNVIYIKNKRECGELAMYFDQQGYYSRALTSETKEGDIYLEITKDSMIPKKVKFIVTTNVLSVGVNILNKNIGGVAMFNEYDPIEIKQFAKRFRNAKNLSIDVVNPLPKSFDNQKSVQKRKELHGISKQNLKMLLEQIKKQNKIIKKFSQEHWDNYKKYSFEDAELGTPQGIVNDCLKRLLINDSYIYEEIVKTYNSPKLLEKAFQNLEYNDIKAKVTELDQKLLKDYESSLSKEAKVEFKNRFNEIIDDFIAKKFSYCFSTLEILKFFDYKQKELFKKFVFSKINFDGFDNQGENIPENVNGYLFKKHIIDPLLEFIPYFNDIDLCLTFLKKFKPEHRKKHVLSLYVNRQIQNYCNFEEINNSFILKYKIDSAIYQSAFAKDKLFLDLVIEASDYLIGCRGMNLKDFRNHLMGKKSVMNIIKNSDKNEFPYDMIKGNKLNTNFLLGIANGLFIVKPKQGRVIDKNGDPKFGFTFERDLNKYKNNRKIVSTRHFKKTKNSRTSTPVKLERIINSPEVINSF